MSEFGVSTIKQTVSIDMVVTAYGFIADDNLTGLNQMGLDGAAISCLKQLKNTDIKLAQMAFEQALSIQTYVDPHILRRVLINDKVQEKEAVLLCNLIKAGASFEMVRYFFKSHTNRKHTAMRQEYEEDLLIIKENKKIQGEVADGLFGDLIAKNQVINAKDILKISNENNYSMSSIWKELKVFVENGK